MEDAMDMDHYPENMCGWPKWMKILFCPWYCDAENKALNAEWERRCAESLRTGAFPPPPPPGMLVAKGG